MDIQTIRKIFLQTLNSEFLSQLQGFAVDVDELAEKLTNRAEAVDNLIQAQMASIRLDLDTMLHPLISKLDNIEQKAARQE